MSLRNRITKLEKRLDALMTCGSPLMFQCEAGNFRHLDRKDHCHTQAELDEFRMQGKKIKVCNAMIDTPAIPCIVYCKKRAGHE
jgi:hypothetical protein